MKNVQWGVLGTAGIARSTTIPAMRMANNCDLYAIAGRNPDKVRQFQETFGFEKGYCGFDELIADPQVEAVYIPLPNDLHKEWVIRALNAKKHVLCEKPLALSAAQEEEMFRAAEDNGVCLMEAFAYQHSPIVAAIKHELDDGAIGEIRYLESAFIGGLPKPGDYRWRKEAGGGAVYDLGCYAVSMILWMMGREPAEVRATAQFSDGGVDLETSALLLYENDAAAGADCGMIPGISRLDRFHVMGTEGEIHSALEFNQCGEISYTLRRDGKTETKTLTAPKNYQLEVEQLGRCIAEGEAPHVSKAFSLLVARTTDRILKAAGY